MKRENPMLGRVDPKPIHYDSLPADSISGQPQNQHVTLKIIGRKRAAEDGNSIQAPPVRDEPSTVPSAPERAEEPDPEFDNLRAVLIEADETEDLAIKRLAEQFRDLRSKFVGNLHMDESEKERFRILSTKAAQTWLRI